MRPQSFRDLQSGHSIKDVEIEVQEALPKPDEDTSFCNC